MPIVPPLRPHHDTRTASRPASRRTRWLFCALAALAATACVAQSGGRTGAPADTPAGMGGIGGAIAFADGAAPALRICALGEADARGVIPRRCVDTPTGARAYRIDGLAPGAYSVLAETRDARRLSGGHLQQVQCIRAPCPEMPATVNVTAGNTTDGIVVGGFQAHRDDLPALSGGE